MQISIFKNWVSAVSNMMDPTKLLLKNLQNLIVYYATLKAFWKYPSGPTTADLFSVLIT